MVISIAEAVAEWRNGRENDYRQQIAGDPRTDATEQPGVGASEILRVFEGPKPVQGKPTVVNDSAAAEVVEAVCDVLKATAERLLAQVASIKQDLLAERAEARADLQCLLDYLAAQKRLIEGRTGKSTQSVQCGEMAEAEVVFAAQQRIGSQSIKKQDSQVPLEQPSVGTP
jgi:hypothetical protein